MNCLICGREDWLTIYSYDKPDKYEKWMGITDVQRSWEQCECGFYQSERNYPIEDLQKIYTDGYRDEGFRHKSIDEAFQYIMDLPPEQSENERRLESFKGIIDNRSTAVLDMGSGLGVFPKRLEESGYFVWCVEPNRESQKFIEEKLEIFCDSEIPKHLEFDVATLIHVLEHIVDPVPFLEEIKEVLSKEGLLYIEVPDASEFDNLSKGHNEFSSDHVYFYDLTSLREITSRAGFEMKHSFYTHYEDRNLSRLTMICQ
jgi:SAM-dependent methyltransferase